MKGRCVVRKIFKEKWIKTIFCKKKKCVNGINSSVNYIHPAQIEGMYNDIDNIIQQLGAAIVVAGKMKVNNCEVERFKMYKKMFHELWIGIAEPYNNINAINVEEKSNGIYVA